MTPTLERIRALRHSIEELGEAAGISEIRIFGSVDHITQMIS
jgi:predicted nucleotidyltransferase